MADPERLLADPEASPLGRALLASVEGDAMPPESRARVAGKLGIAATLALTTTTAGQGLAAAVWWKIGTVLIALTGVTALAISQTPDEPAPGAVAAARPSASPAPTPPTAVDVPPPTVESPAPATPTKAAATPDAPASTKAPPTTDAPAPKVVAKTDASRNPDAPATKVVAKADAPASRTPDGPSSRVAAKADAPASRTPDAPSPKVAAKADAPASRNPDAPTPKVAAKADASPSMKPDVPASPKPDAPVSPPTTDAAKPSGTAASPKPDAPASPPTTDAAKPSGTAASPKPDAPVSPKPAPVRVDARSLAAEVALLDRARTAVRTRDPQAAAVALDEYARAFPGGALLAEAEVVGIEVLVQRGEAAAAAARARAFLARYPQSPLARRVRSLALPQEAP